MGKSFQRRRSTSLILFMAIPWCTLTIHAQSIYMKDGQTIATQGVRRDGDSVLARIHTNAGTSGEVGYPIANIVRIDFPEPAQLKIASDLLNTGKADEALRQLTPILAYYVPFRDLSGGWWTPLALLQVDVLTRLGRDREVDTLVSDIARVGSTNPDTLRAVKIKQAAAIERKGDHGKALDAVNPIIKDPTATQQSVVEAWLTVGSAKLALGEYKDALLAFLHVPVYTPDRALLMPPALLGSASAYRGLGDRQREQTALKELIASYASAPEAAEAKNRLQKLTSQIPSSTGD